MRVSPVHIDVVYIDKELTICFLELWFAGMQTAQWDAALSSAQGMWRKWNTHKAACDHRRRPSIRPGTFLSTRYAKRVTGPNKRKERATVWEATISLLFLNL